jgi:hypothetical protein
MKQLKFKIKVKKQFAFKSISTVDQNSSTDPTTTFLTLTLRK